MVRIPRRTIGRVRGNILVEGRVRKGGAKPKPSSPKPSIKPEPQKPSPKKSE